MYIIDIHGLGSWSSFPIQVGWTSNYKMDNLYNQSELALIANIHVFL